MLIDYGVSDHWVEGTPAWLKSLVSSLDRRHGVSSVIPLTVIAGEIAEWVRLASGVDAWRTGANRTSLRMDLERSASAIGSSLRQEIAAPLATFRAAFVRLEGSSRATLGNHPGTRSDAVWTDVVTAATSLLDALKSTRAASSGWEDLVAAAQDRSLAGREYRPIAELFFEQLQSRGHDADRTFGRLISIVSDGFLKVGDLTQDETNKLLDEVLVKAKALIEMPVDEEPIVIWLGYKGRIFQHLEAGRVAFYDALWSVPNAEPGRQDFPHKKELWEIIQQGHAFRIAKRSDEESDVDTIVRVDLGSTFEAGAFDRARAMVDTIISVAIHREGGIRPQLAEYHVLRSGALASSGRHAIYKEMGFPDDSYGAGITTDAIGRHAPRIAEALSREELPRFLAAAIESQSVADHPFSRDMALRKPSEADISSVIPLSDRVVQHVAAHAGMGPNDLVKLLGERWPHARWLSDLQRAAGMCLLGLGTRQHLLTELTREWMADRPKQPWLLFLADRGDDFLSLCRLEHERTWIERMFASVSDHTIYGGLIADYAAEGRELEARRHRVRNALVHGNPATFAIVESVREYAEFLSGTALYLALDSFADATDPAVALSTRTNEYIALQGGQDAASYWRDHVASVGWPLPA